MAVLTQRINSTIRLKVLKQKLYKPSFVEVISIDRKSLAALLADK